MGSPAVQIALFQITDAANSRLYLSKTLKRYHTFVLFQNGRQESDAHTETADQIHHLISFPVPLELRFGETTICSKFFLQQFPPNCFLSDPIFFLFDEVRQETSLLISPEGEKLREKIN